MTNPLENLGSFNIDNIPQTADTICHKNDIYTKITLAGDVTYLNGASFNYINLGNKFDKNVTNMYIYLGEIFEREPTLNAEYNYNIAFKGIKYYNTTETIATYSLVGVPGYDYWWQFTVPQSLCQYADAYRGTVYIQELSTETGNLSNFTELFVSNDFKALVNSNFINSDVTISNISTIDETNFLRVVKRTIAATLGSDAKFTLSDSFLGNEWDNGVTRINCTEPMSRFANVIPTGTGTYAIWFGILYNVTLYIISLPIISSDSDYVCWILNNITRYAGTKITKALLVYTDTTTVEGVDTINYRYISDQSDALSVGSSWLPFATALLTNSGEVVVDSQNNIIDIGG